MRRLLQLGQIRYNEQERKYQLLTGHPIRRAPGEGLVQALERIGIKAPDDGVPPRVNLVMVEEQRMKDEVEAYLAQTYHGESEDEHDDGPYWAQSIEPTCMLEHQEQSEDENTEEYHTYAVEKGKRKINEARKEVTRGPGESGGKERNKHYRPQVEVEVPRRTRNDTNRIERVDANPSSENAIVQAPIPVDARQVRFQAPMDVEMSNDSGTAGSET